ncbi:MAG: sulfurtransferase [Gammaproteobacteria bacterium]|nr:MAG: sulfurtransferase [Gammaproteobacteria bacterium]
MPWLINASQLDKLRKSQKNVMVLDASWHLPTEGRHAKEEFLKSHIIGARFLDLEAFNDRHTTLPNMLVRDEAIIQQLVSELGITNDHKIIFYDHSDLHTSCRALWMFKCFGHNPQQLYILDGGYQAWERYGGKIESDEPRNVAKKAYLTDFQAHHIRTLMQMKTNLHHPTEQTVDLRHPVRYAGGPEHRPHLRAGHIPGSISFPYMTMFETDGRFKPIDKIRKQLTGIGVDLQAPIVTTCGSGITSTILNFVLDLMSHSEHALYDGSWSEWGWDQVYPGEESIAERPVETSLEK